MTTQREDPAVLVLRATVALIFLAHAVVRSVNGSIPQFGAFLDSQGLVYGNALVAMVTVYELAAGTLLLLNLRVRAAAAGLAGVVLGGIVLIHARAGWFVGEHGIGGMEFSVLLLASLAVIAFPVRAGSASIPQDRPANASASDR